MLFLWVVCLYFEKNVAGYLNIDDTGFPHISHQTDQRNSFIMPIIRPSFSKSFPYGCHIIILPFILWNHYSIIFANSINWSITPENIGNHELQWILHMEWRGNKITWWIYTYIRQMEASVQQMKVGCAGCWKNLLSPNIWVPLDTNIQVPSNILFKM